MGRPCVDRVALTQHFILRMPTYSSSFPLFFILARSPLRHTTISRSLSTNSFTTLPPDLLHSMDSLTSL